MDSSSLRSPTWASMLLDRGFARNSVGRDGNGSNGQGVVSLETEHQEEALWALTSQDEASFLCLCIPAETEKAY